MAKESAGSGEIHRADPHHRQRMLVWLVLMVLAGGAGLYALVRWLEDLRHASGRDPGEMVLWLQRLMAGLCLVLAAGSAGLAHWLHRVARSTSSGKRWPPREMQTTADTPVRYLSAAEAMARQIRLASTAFALLAAATAGWALWLLLL